MFRIKLNKTFCITFILFLITISPGNLCAQTYWKLPQLPAPHAYGDILINRLSQKGKAKAVYFSHWSHRLKYACSVCHLELEFAFATNETLITEDANKSGEYCGACHDGKQAFGHTKENCDKCHLGEMKSNRDKFYKATNMLPKTKFGNKVNWTRAISVGEIQPVFSLYMSDEKKMKFGKKLTLEAEWSNVPPAYFPHDAHEKWLDCGNCHPDIFNIKKKTTKHFSMESILEKKFCGVCHLRVAFPLDDCKRCHPKMSSGK